MGAPTKKTITDATNASPIVISSSGHGYSTGNTIQVAGIVGNEAANGIWKITVVDAGTYSLNGSSGSGAYSSGGYAQIVDLGSTNLSSQDLKVSEETTTTGTSDLTLGGAPAGYAPVAVLSNGQQAEYVLFDSNGAFLESGLGTFNESTNTFTRTEVFATTGTELTRTPIDLQAGTKTLFVKTESLITSDIADLGEFVQIQNGVPVPQIMGMLTVVNSDIAMSVDVNRCGPASNTIFFRRSSPNLEDGTVRLLQTSQRVICEPAALQAADLTQRFVDVTIPRPVETAWRCAINGASPLPFTVDGNKLPAQTTMSAFKPADVFMFMPHVQPGQPIPMPTIFYLNWYSNTARNNGNVGAPVGHDVAFGNTLRDWSYLDVTGSFSTFITSTEVFAKLPRRYLYLGTIGGINDGTVINQLNKMMVWNLWNRVTYSRVFPETTDGWGPPLRPGGRNLFTRMNPTAYSQVAGAPANAMYLSPWAFVSVVGKSPVFPGFNLGQVLAGNVNANNVNAWATMAASYEFVGNLRVKMAAFSSENGNGEVLGTDHTPPIYAISADLANDTVNLLGTDGAFGNSRCVDTNIGMRIYHVMQALGTNPLGNTVAANAVTPRFSGVASRITTVGEC